MQSPFFLMTAQCAGHKNGLNVSWPGKATFFLLRFLVTMVSGMRGRYVFDISVVALI